MEVDLRTKEENKRTLKYFVNNKQLKFTFTCLPSEVRFAVCNYFILNYFFLCFKSLLNNINYNNIYRYP